MTEKAVIKYEYALIYWISAYSLLRDTKISLLIYELRMSTFLVIGLNWIFHESILPALVNALHTDLM